MIPTTVDKQAQIDFDTAARPLAGQATSGDLYLVKSFDRGVLFATIDGVGHGDEATAAAEAAVATLEKHWHEPVISLLNRCHEALKKTRGVVMTVASLDTAENTVTWLGVGNVEGRLLRADASASHPSECVLLRSGVVGYHLPALHASVVPVAAGDLLIFATDGIRADFAEGLNQSQPPRQIADAIMGRHFKGTDDALVLVARYLGMSHE